MKPYAVIGSADGTNARVVPRYDGSPGVAITHSSRRVVMFDPTAALLLADALVDAVEQQRAQLGVEAANTAAKHNHTNQRSNAALSQAESAGIN